MCEGCIGLHDMAIFTVIDGMRAYGSAFFDMNGSFEKRII